MKPNKPTTETEIKILKKGERIPCEQCGCHALGIIKKGYHCHFCQPEESTTNQTTEELRKEFEEKFVMPDDGKFPVHYKQVLLLEDEMEDLWVWIMEKLTAAEAEGRREGAESKEKELTKNALNKTNPDYLPTWVGEFAPNLGHDPHNPYPLKKENQ